MRGRRLRLASAVLATALASLLALGWWKVLRIEQATSWPPGPEAVTADGAQAAAEAFAADGGNGPHDVGIEYAWSTAATIEPWAEGRNFYPRMLGDIEAARSSVHVLMFGWREGTVGTRLADALVRKLADGVEVRVIVDAFGSRPYGDAADMYTRLADAGAQIVVNDVLPLDRDGLYQDRHLDWTQDEVGRADHRKLLVIDGTVAWCGGAGFEDHFADGRFHDVMARVTGDVVRQAQAVFLTSFSAHDAPLPSELDRYFPPQPERGAERATMVQVVPGGFQSATQAIRERIDAARVRLDVMNPYLTDADMINRIAAAARRGARVRVVVSETSNNPQASAALRRHYGELIDAGVEIWEYPDAVVHAKLVVADDWVQIGTVNLDSWALYRNLEVGILAESADAAELLEARVFDPDIARSRRAAPPEDGAFANWLWDTLSYFL